MMLPAADYAGCQIMETILIPINLKTEIPYFFLVSLDDPVDSLLKFGFG